MIFNNLGLNDLKLSFFFWQILGHALQKKFDFSTDENDLKVAFCQIYFCSVECFSAL